jgi:hypothetical protein
MSRAIGLVARLGASSHTSPVDLMSDTSRIVRVFVEVDGFESVREAQDYVADQLMPDPNVLSVATDPPNGDHWHMQPCSCKDSA